MAEKVKLNKPEYKVVVKWGSILVDDGVYVAKEEYRLGMFGYIKKNVDLIMRVDGCSKFNDADLYCKKLNEAEKEKYNDD